MTEKELLIIVETLKEFQNIFLEMKSGFLRNIKILLMKRSRVPLCTKFCVWNSYSFLITQTVYPLT